MLFVSRIFSLLVAEGRNSRPHIRIYFTKTCEFYQIFIWFFSCHPGLAYGDGELKGPGDPGQAVKLTGDDEFTVCSAVTDAAVGILGSLDILEHETPAANNLHKAAVWMNGGIYETDKFTAGAAAGDDLMFDTSAKEIKKWVTETPPPQVIGRALSVAGGILKFRLNL